MTIRSLALNLKPAKNKMTLRPTAISGGSCYTQGLPIWRAMPLPVALLGVPTRSLALLGAIMPRPPDSWTTTCKQQ
jgi:hypothetical protein